MADLSPLTYTAIASLGTYALVKGFTDSKDEGFAVDCASTKVKLDKKAADCTRADLKDSVKEADLVKFCKKKANSSKKVCQGVDVGKKTPAPGGSSACTGKESFKAKIKKNCPLTGTDLENACTKDSAYSNKNLDKCRAFAPKCAGMKAKAKSKYDMCKATTGATPTPATVPSPTPATVSSPTPVTVSSPTPATVSSPTPVPAPTTPTVPRPTPSSSDYEITVKIGKTEVDFEIDEDWTVQDLIDAVKDDDDLSSEIGLLGLGRLGLINFSMIVDEDEDEPVTGFEMDDVLVDLADIGDGTVIEIAIDNTVAYAILAGILLLCSALIGLLVYFMFMQGGYY